MTDFESVEEWLSSVKLLQYKTNFREYQIDYEQLQYIDSSILKDIGVAKIGDRIKLEREILKLRKVSPQKLLEVNELFQALRSARSTINLAHLSDDNLLLDKEHFKLEPPPASKLLKSSVSFILQNGSTVKLNVTGCFNAASIKKKLIKFLDLPIKSAGYYDTYVTDKLGNLHLLFDVELVTICHSIERIEKNRLLFCPKTEQPSKVAIDVSKTYASLEPDLDTHGDNEVNHVNKGDSQDSKFRKIFGQRPTSQLISTNLSQYFPETNQQKLQKTITNSVRYSIRMSSYGGNKRKSTIGDFLVDNNNRIDQARLSVVGTMDSLNLKSSMAQNKQRFSIASSIDSDRTSKIELFDIGSDSDEGEDFISTTAASNLNINHPGPNSWLKGARIGSGSFGTVYLGMSPLTGELMAVKQVELNPLIDESKEGTGNSEAKRSTVHQKIVESLQHEMKLLSELHHENIVTYLGSSSDETHLNIFLEYVPGGSLNTMLINYGPFEEPLIRNFTRQILIGINYLHSQNIIHRDIKGANILIDIKGEVKISDFGISKKLTPNSNVSKRASLQGSVYWMAPEVVKQIATTTKADIWSVGCLVVEMFTGKHPFPNFSQMQAIFKIGTHNIPDIPAWCTQEARDFLEKTFILDHTKRPSAAELLEHGFLEPLIS